MSLALKGVLLAGVLALVTAAGAAEPALAPDREHQDLSYYLDAAGARHPIKTPADWESRRKQIVAGMEAVMGPLPGPEMRVPLDVKVEEEARVGELVRRKITYRTSPRQRVAAYLFLPPLAPGKKAPAMLCLHPAGELGKGIAAALGGKPHRQYALELAQRGYVTLAPDYPTFGDYKCEFDPKDGFQSGTMRAIWDNIRSVDLLQRLEQVDGSRIGAIGHSLGGHNAMFTAVFEPRLRAVVSSCGFTRFHKYYEGNLTGWTSPRYMPRIATVYDKNPDRMPFDFPEVVAALAPRPFFTNSPLHDGNFEVSGVRDCLASARPIFALYGKTDHLQAVHPDSEHDFPDAPRMQAYAFLDQHLKPAVGTTTPAAAPGATRVERDVEYARPEGKPLLLDLYLPEDDSRRARPVVIWVHGGGWNAGSKQNCPARWLAGEGFAVASINYRLTQEAIWPAQIDDCRAAVRWLRENAAIYQLDAAHIGVWGGSAGGHLAALLGTLDAPREERTSSRVQAVCDWYGPADLLTMPANVLSEGKTEDDLARTNGAKLLGGAVRSLPAKAKEASAFYQVSRDDPPFLIMHGDADPQVPLAQSEKLFGALKQSGVEATFRVVPGAGHGGKAFDTPDMRQVVRAFFARHLLPQSSR